MDSKDKEKNEYFIFYIQTSEKFQYIIYVYKEMYNPPT